MISLTNYDFQWARSELVIIYPARCINVIQCDWKLYIHQIKQLWCWPQELMAGFSCTDLKPLLDSVTYYSARGKGSLTRSFLWNVTKKKNILCGDLPWNIGLYFLGLFSMVYPEDLPLITGKSSINPPWLHSARPMATLGMSGQPVFRPFQSGPGQRWPGRRFQFASNIHQIIR